MELPFKICKILDYGTSNPIVNRMSFQFIDILSRNALDLPALRIENVKKYLFECMKDLIKAQEIKDAYLREEKKAIEKIMSIDGIKFQTNAYSYDDPSEILKKHFEDFLIRCVIAIRKIVKIAENILLKSVKGPKELRKHLMKIFPKDSPEIKMIDEDSIWIKELYDMRGQVEHDELLIGKFDVNISADNKVLIKLPIILNNQIIIRSYIENIFDNCFTFCEDMTVILMNTKCKKEFQIVVIPESQRSTHRHFKYTLDLEGEYKEKLIEAIRKSETSPPSD